MTNMQKTREAFEELERAGLVRAVGTQIGADGKLEKVYALTAQGQADAETAMLEETDEG